MYFIKYPWKAIFPKYKPKYEQSHTHDWLTEWVTLKTHQTWKYSTYKYFFLILKSVWTRTFQIPNPAIFPKCGWGSGNQIKSGSKRLRNTGLHLGRGFPQASLRRGPWCYGSGAASSKCTRDPRSIYSRDLRVKPSPWILCSK